MVPDIESIIYFGEYTHTCPSTGQVYHPYYDLMRRQWRMTNWSYSIKFIEVCALCNIPEDERIILALKYNGTILQTTA